MGEVRREIQYSPCKNPSDTDPSTHTETMTNPSTTEGGRPPWPAENSGSTLEQMNQRRGPWKQTGTVFAKELGILGHQLFPTAPLIHSPHDSWRESLPCLKTADCSLNKTLTALQGLAVSARHPRIPTLQPLAFLSTQWTQLGSLLSLGLCTCCASCLGRSFRASSFASFRMQLTCLLRIALPDYGLN